MRIVSGIVMFLFLFTGYGTLSHASPMLITSAGDSNLNGSSLLDFNSEVHGGFVSRTFSNAVTITSSIASTMYVTDTFDGSYGNTGTHLTKTTTNASITFDFITDVSAFGWSWGSADKAHTLSLYNNTAGYLGTLNIPGQTNPYIGFIGAYDTTYTISKVILHAKSDYLFMDDFEYVTAGNPPAVPEPATVALLGIGLVGLAGAEVRRRRKKKADGKS